MAIVFDAQGNLVDTEGDINFFNTGTEQVFPKQGLEPLYPNFGAPMVNDTSLSPDLPYDTLRFVDNNSLSLQPNYLMPNTNKVPQLPANRLEGLPSLNLQSLPANMGVANEADQEQVEYLGNEPFGSKLKRGLESLTSFLPFGENSVLGQLKGILNFRDSPNYRSAPIGVYGYTPAQLNQMNALGGYYSEPMRAYRRNTNRISNMLQRGAAGKSFSQKNLDRLLNQAGLGGVDTRGMMDSIKASSQTGYGGYGSRKAASEAAARGGGRDYSSSPGAMAGDMEYGEE
jgi:hypothetical protein